MARIVSGPFAGHEGEVVSIDGDKVRLKISIFGRPMVVDQSRTYVTLDGEDPRASLRARIVDDQERLAAREQADFWRALVVQPAGDALAEQDAYEAHCAPVREAADARARALLAAFDAEAAALPDAEVRARIEADEPRWFVYATEFNRLRETWRANPEIFEEYKRGGDLMVARRQRAQEAALYRGYPAWRDARWSEEERARRLAVAEAVLAERKPILEERFRREWGLALPDGLFRFWLFFRSLQPSERDAFDGQSLAPFGVMDLFDRPGARARDGIDVRVQGRFYRDPPEMLTFMHGGSDGLHFGLFFDDGERSSGVVDYYNNDGGGLGRPHGTPLMAVRAHLEMAAMHLAGEKGETGDERREQRFKLRLAREAVMRFETGDRPEQGGAYDRAHDQARRAAAFREDDPTHFHTVDEAGALASGEPAQPRGRRFPGTEEARAVEEERRARIAGDQPVVLEWAAEARRRLAAGDPTEALCLGRDLHWLSGTVKAREDLACELLAGAYRALGRQSLAGIVEAHHRHRDLPSVDVLEPDPG